MTTSTPIRVLSADQQRERLLRPWNWTSRRGPDPSSLVGRSVTWTDDTRRSRSGIVFGSPEPVNRSISLVRVCCDASTRVELVPLHRLKVQPLQLLQGPAAPPPGTLKSLDLPAAPKAAPAPAPGAPEAAEAGEAAPRQRKWKAKSPEAQARFNEQRRLKRAAAKAAKGAAK